MDMHAGIWENKALQTGQVISMWTVGPINVIPAVTAVLCSANSISSLFLQYWWGCWALLLWTNVDFTSLCNLTCPVRWYPTGSLKSCFHLSPAKILSLSFPFPLHLFLLTNTSILKRLSLHLNQMDVNVLL